MKAKRFGLLLESNTDLLKKLNLYEQNIKYNKNEYDSKLKILSIGGVNLKQPKLDKNLYNLAMNKVHTNRDY
jgi:hypothetical protein